MEHSSLERSSLEHRSMEHSTVPSVSAPQQKELAGQDDPAGQTDTLALATELVEQGPVRLKQYLTECEEGTCEPANLDLILEVAEYRASNENSLEWAEIAIRAASLGAKTDPTRRHSYLYRAMLVRTLFITRQGSQPGHPVLDPAAIVDWFEAELKFSPAEARRRSERWKDPRFQQEFATELEDHSASEKATNGETPFIKETLNDLLELQLLKYRVQLLRRLAECGELPPEAKLNEWLQTAKFLP